MIGLIVEEFTTTLKNFAEAGLNKIYFNLITITGLDLVAILIRDPRLLSRASSGLNFCCV